MAYSSSPSTVSGGAELWETDLDEVFVFRGDYREHMHLEDPTKPLYNGQLSLPSLPVTPLKESCEVYLRSVRALATDEEYAKTKQSVGEFVKPGGKGEVLQRRLEQRARDYGDSSWLQHWWNAGSYLEFRMANVINVSYFFSFADLPAGFRGKQVLRASLLAHGALKFRQAVCRGDDVNAGKIPGSIGPGCATPYKYMFNACRIPLPGSDKGLHYSPHVPEYQKIVVIRKGQFFTFQACEGAAGGWEPYGPKRLATQLSAVLKMAENSADYPPVGAMAGADRDAWSAARARMSADAGNREFLDAVQSAIFCVCLDDTAPVTRTDTGRALWHGDSRQRWYDKSIQIIVFENGKAGLMGEHSNYDGMPAVGLSDFILNHEREVLARYEEGAPGNPQLGRGGGGAASTAPMEGSNGGIPPRNISQLLNLSKASAWDLGNAIAEFNQLIGKHDLQVFPYHGVGSTRIKSLGCSPDAFAQMSIQLAYKRMFGVCRATYEPFSMRQYRHGRTETVRSVSIESQAFVAAMDDRSVGGRTRAEALRAACSAHSAYSKKARTASVCDRHLMGLSMLVGPSEETPSLFTDPMYWKSKTWHVSTSNLSNELFDGWGWGEVVPDGIGVAYSTNKDVLLFNVTSARGFAAPFCQFLEDAVKDMVNTLERAELGKSKL